MMRMENINRPSERCKKSCAGEVENCDPASDKSKGVIVWSTSELLRIIWKRSTSVVLGGGVGHQQLTEINKHIKRTQNQTQKNTFDFAPAFVYNVFIL